VVMAEPTHIHQILMNLATNAAHAMREQGGTLKVTLSSVAFGPGEGGRRGNLGPGDYLKLTVEDTGHGMEQATTERIFDPYFTTKGPGEGTGLGLAVVHGIVTRYGGAIEVYSEPEKGTVFEVYLPKLESGDRSKSEASTPIPRGSETILLVDDEEELTNAGRQMLEHLGYKVTATTSSPDALDLFLQQPQHFDLVITDYTMPRMTGVVLAEKIRQIRSDIPIIVCTGFSERINENSAKEMRISAFVMKPVTLRSIAELIRKTLEKRES
jgi:two-component system, cell cycle sensor histidine kinase and response regulator CckA